MEIDILTPDWGLPFLGYKKYKGLKGGRGSGKSHFFGEAMIEDSIMDANAAYVCIREVQKSLQFSSKRLLEDKIYKFGVSHLFHITDKMIRRRGGDGLIIFQGMQDHTADSIKSLEGFKIAWVEEAQNLSKRSLSLLRPTLRREDSELWFSWNPDQPTDPVDAFFAGNPPDSVCAHINFDRNPLFPETLRKEMEYDRRVDPQSYEHIWLGDYNNKKHTQVLHGKWCVEEFEPMLDWDGPYFGADWGFSVDPTTLVKLWINDKTLFVEYELYKVGLEISDTPAAFRTIDGAADHVIRADSARPETISHVRRSGLNVIAAKKGAGSVEDGVAFLRHFERIVIHPRCKHAETEARLWSHKTDRLTGDIKPDIIDAHNHIWDAVRYALEPLISQTGGGFITI